MRTKSMIYVCCLNLLEASDERTIFFSLFLNYGLVVAIHLITENWSELSLLTFVTYSFLN